MMVQTETIPTEEPQGPYLSDEEYRKEQIKQLQKAMSTYMHMKKEEESLSDGRRKWFNKIISEKREEIRELMEEKEQVKN